MIDLGVESGSASLMKHKTKRFWGLKFLGFGACLTPPGRRVTGPPVLGEI